MRFRLVVLVPSPSPGPYLRASYSHSCSASPRPQSQAQLVSSSLSQGDALGQVKSSLQMKWPNWLQFARHRLAGLSASVVGSAAAIPFLTVL